MSWFDDNDPEAPQRRAAPSSSPDTYQGVLPPQITVPHDGSTPFDVGAAQAAARKAAGVPDPSANPFSKSSTSADLLSALNAAGATPGSDKAAALTKQYTDALGISGNALPTGGFSVGQYDPTRSKIYLPGTDLKYDNGQWGAHDFGTADQTAANPLDSALLQPYTKTFDYAPFSAPTDVTEQNDPGYQFRLQQGQQALERAAAARGTLLTGGTAKDEQAYGQGFASNEYSNVYNRAAQDYNTNRNNAYQQYLGDESTFYANQNNPFAKLLSLSTLDSQNAMGYAQLNSSNTNAANNLNFNYAQLGANNLNQGANAYGNYTTQAGNAQAAGTVGGANAWQNAFGQAGNTALGLYYNSQYPPNRSPYGGYPGMANPYGGG
jgi:hypothetical protein